jgi:2-polyprenyl-3-methyl-5-hydroxy-6-metoxy-1,4-benzoquinol methylase
MIENNDWVEWNNRMFEKHPTPYRGLAGFVEHHRVRAVCSLAQIKEEDSVLEIGCEAGNLLLSLPQCKRLVGFDISTKALAEAAAKFGSNRRPVEFFHGDATKDLPFNKNEFSVIICSEMLEHVSAPRAVLENIVKIASTSSRIVLTVPNERPILFIKKLLSKLRIFRLLLPTIEAEQSEWHLHRFSKLRLIEKSRSLFTIEKVRFVLGLRVIALARIKHT